jgi:chromatin assembly factor 1 subunit A
LSPCPFYFYIILTINQEKERLEKKAAKVEKEKKAKDAENKSRNLMATFFSKPKAPIASSSKVGESSTGSSRPQTDFERTFKPFLLKKGSSLAPLNLFKVPKRQKRNIMASAIITDSDVVMLGAPESASDVGTMTPRGAYAGY